MLLVPLSVLTDAWVSWAATYNKVLLPGVGKVATALHLDGACGYIQALLVVTVCVFNTLNMCYLVVIITQNQLCAVRAGVDHSWRGHQHHTRPSHQRGK